MMPQRFYNKNLNLLLMWIAILCKCIYNKYATSQHKYVNELGCACNDKEWKHGWFLKNIYILSFCKKRTKTFASYIETK